MPWMMSARLASALRLAGFHVEAVCQLGHPLRDLRNPIRTHRLGWVREAASIEKTIDSADPDLILPCDDPAVAILHHLHRCDRSGTVSALIERSLGDPASFTIAASRSALMALARSMGLLVPESRALMDSRRACNPAELQYPCVLKRDRTWSGIGTVVVHHAAELDKAWSWIGGWTSVLRAGKAAFRARRPRTFLDLAGARSVAIEIQEFVPGLPANRAVLCHAGKVLAGFSVLALKTAYPGGPASVVRVIDHTEMTETVKALVARLGLSGFCGFDFVIDPAGRAYLLELNPRATPVSHLALAGGTHLPAALYRQMTGRNPRSAPTEIPRKVIALFPTEWQRDRSSVFLSEAHHDLPSSDPALLARVGLSYAGEEDEKPIQLPTAQPTTSSLTR
jgi:predicted ATP-grasp superfamily ATP-dependent carboligase